MESSDTEVSPNSNSDFLHVHLLTCRLCDVVFAKEFKDDYHTIVSGYNSQGGNYLQNGKFQTNHILTHQLTVTLKESDFALELDEIVQKVRDVAEAFISLVKTEPDFDFNVRRIVCGFYAKRGEGS